MPGSPTDGERAASVAVFPTDDPLWFVDLALGQMTAIVEELGESLVNRRPPFPRRQLRLRHRDPLPGGHGVLGRRHGGRAPGRARPRHRNSRPVATSPACCGAPSRPGVASARTWWGLRPEAASGQRRPARPRRPRPLHRDEGRRPGPRPRGAVPACRADGAHPGHAGGREPEQPVTAGGCGDEPIACSLDAASFREHRQANSAHVRGFVGRLGGLRRNRRASGAAPVRCRPARRRSTWPSGRSGAAPFFDVSIVARSRSGAHSSSPCPTAPRRCWHRSSCCWATGLCRGRVRR